MINSYKFYETVRNKIRILMKQLNVYKIPNNSLHEI